MTASKGTPTHLPNLAPESTHGGCSKFVLHVRGGIFFLFFPLPPTSWPTWASSGRYRVWNSRAGVGSTYTILYYTILHYTITILYYTIQYYTILYYTIPYYTMLCYAMLCYAMLYCTVLYCTVLCCAVLCCAVLCCAVHTILYYTIQ